MSAKSRAKKKSGGKRRGGAGDNDLVAGLKDRITVLENMLRLKQEDAISQDAAERKRIERELNLMQFSVEKASDEIFWMDSNGMVIYVNDATCSILGYSRDELLGMYVWDFDPTYSPEIWLNSFNDLKKKGFLTFETKHKTRDGVVFPVEIMANYVEYDGNAYSFAFVLDITERKRAEGALRESEASLAKAQRITHLGNWEWDVMADKVFCSDEFYRVFGLDRRDYITYGQFIDTLCTGDRDRINHAVEAALYKGEHYSIDYCVVRPDSSEHIIHAEGEVTYSSGGEPVKMFGTVQDITERKRAEEALRDSQARLNSIFRAAPTGIGVVVDRVILDVNDRLCVMMGYTREELLGKNARILYPSDEDYEHVGREKYDQINRCGTGTVETQWRHKNGSVMDILLSSTPMEPCDLHAGVTFTALDITERKRAEKALRESEERFRALADNIPNLAWMANADGWIFWYNKQWYDYTGTTLEEMQGWGWQKVHHPDYVKAVTEEWSARIKEGKPYDNIFPLKSKGGKYRWFLTRVTPIIDSQGKIQRWFGTNTDITERKQAENALEAAKQQAELYLDLMSHDINNMHQIALGYLELAKDMLAGGEQAEFLDKPVEVLQRSARLIGNVQKMQKLLDGSLHTQVIDLSELLRDVQRDYGAVPNKPVTLDLNGSDHCHVQANELLQDVFSNLVTNAIKHTGDRTNIAITLDDVNDNGSHFYRVSVADNGPGIPDNSKGFIFNRVLKGTNKAKGMGIGLYLVKSLVENYNGRVWVEDRVSGDHTKGARFVVMLPAVEE